jgi:GH35 family endo-1,4-beta-xylanase
MRFPHFFLLAMALAAAAPLSAAELVIDPAQATIRTIGGPVAGGVWNLWSNGRVGETLNIERAGNYEVRVRAHGSPAGGVWPNMALIVDGMVVKLLAVDSAEAADYRFSARLGAGMREVAIEFGNDALVAGEDRNLYLHRMTIVAPEGVAGPTVVPLAQRRAALERREAEIVAATASAIDKHRKADAVLRFVDATGQPLAHAKVRVEQTGHEFLFGCNIYRFDRFKTAEENEAYKRRFAELFNYATVGFYWRWYENQRGKPEYAYTDRVVDWCRQHGIAMKGHPLLWGDEAGVPPWSQGQPAAEVQRQRVFDIMQRYREKIAFWEVVNEPAHQPVPKIDDPYRWAREADPKSYLIVNDYFVLADGQPQFFALLDAAKRAGVPFDGIGIQAHEPRTMRFPLDQVQRILDRYATLGKQLHITEFTPTSAGQPIAGSHREGVWDEAAQADYATKFYRVCFAHPSMMAITWWDLCDNGAWLPGGGMLRADLSPKPVYQQLYRLIHDEWTTKLEGTTDADGLLKFRGFKGAYRATIVEQAAPQTFKLGEGGKTITIGMQPAE